MLGSADGNYWSNCNQQGLGMMTVILDREGGVYLDDRDYKANRRECYGFLIRCAFAACHSYRTDKVWSYHS